MADCTGYEGTCAELAQKKVDWSAAVGLEAKKLIADIVISCLLPIIFPGFSMPPNWPNSTEAELDAWWEDTEALVGGEGGPCYEEMGGAG